jgi:hypothetical protein
MSQPAKGITIRLEWPDIFRNVRPQLLHTVAPELRGQRKKPPVLYGTGGLYDQLLGLDSNQQPIG